ncbi:MAG: HAMP domain-containing sensor histidine kinase, partial [Pseudomonadota bacterium]
ADLAGAPCLRDAEASGFMLPAVPLALRYLGCLPTAPAYDALATARAARLLRGAGRLPEARRALLAGSTVPDLTLDAGLERGIPAAWLAEWRLTHIDLEIAGGNEQDAHDAVLALTAQLAALDGPQLEGADDLTVLLLDRVHALSTPLEAANATAELERAQRRFAAWHEVQDRLSQRGVMSGSERAPQLLRDPFASPPFLLLYRSLGASGLAGAVQVDEGVLVELLLQVIEQGAGARVLVSDGSGRRLGGATSRIDRQHELTFPLVFDYLRVSAPTAQVRVPGPERTRMLAMQLLPVGVSLALGFIALLARSAAARGQRELDTRRREFTTRVTHELKTPLAGVRVMAEALEMGAFRGDEDRADLARRIIRESERLAKRVDEVLDMTRQPSDLRREPTDIEAMCQDLAERWRDLAEQAGGSLHLRLTPLPLVAVERDRLRDALAALLENAIKYRHPERPLRIELSVRASGRWLVFEVCDNGIGIPADKREVVFEPFTRVEGPGRGPAGGHGLGLSFVANAARVHGGRAECRGVVNGGSRFILRIRRATGQGAPGGLWKWLAMWKDWRPWRAR